MKKNLIFQTSILLAILFPLIIPLASAHCPLCTAGAAVAAGAATWLGVNIMVIGLFIGAFATSLGFWVSNLLRKKFVSFPLQTLLIVTVSFLLTVLPIIPVVEGSDVNFSVSRVNNFLIGSVIGLVIVALSPLLSSGMTKIRKGKFFPFQGIIITILLLIVAGVIIQFLT
ncbi:MAG: hypothetical protein QXS91_04130 [Candidatus Anstonellales archaeon]